MYIAPVPQQTVFRNQNALVWCVVTLLQKHGVTTWMMTMQPTLTWLWIANVGLSGWSTAANSRMPSRQMEEVWHLFSVVSKYCLQVLYIFYMIIYFCCYFLKISIIYFTRLHQVWHFGGWCAQGVLEHLLILESSGRSTILVCGCGYNHLFT